MQSGRRAHHERDLHQGGDQRLSHVAIRRWLSRGRAATAQPAGSEDGLQAAMTLRRRLMVAIAFVALGGVAVSSVSLYHHFSKSKSSFCDINETFNCDLVNRSPYSTFLGVT